MGLNNIFTHSEKHTLLLIGHLLTVDVIGLGEKWWGLCKNTSSYLEQAQPHPYPFCVFPSPPPCLEPSGEIERGFRF